jgi:hypothetical protein
MSNIEITADNIKKFAKRLQKNTKEKGFELSLSESQELLARTLGSNNYNALIKTIQSSSLPLSSKTEENKKEEHQFKYFLNELKTILNHPESGIAICYLENSDNYDYSLVLGSVFGDYFYFKFGMDMNKQYEQDLYTNIVNVGFKTEDATMIFKLLNNIDGNILTNRFNAIQFATKLFEYIGEDKQKYIVKLDLKHLKKHEFVVLDNKLYQLGTGWISKKMVDSIMRARLSYFTNDDGTFNYDYLDVSQRGLIFYRTEDSIKVTTLKDFEKNNIIYISNEWKDSGHY